MASTRKRNNKNRKNDNSHVKKTVIKWAVRASAAVIVLALSVIFALWLYVRQTIPNWSGRIDTPVSGEVRIIRDDSGIPYLYAASEDDLYFAAGFVHARERLFQMDVSRRYAAGTLAELLGKRSVTSDKKMRVLNLSAVAGKGLNSVSEKTRRLLERYAEGVNYVVDNGPIPLEYKILKSRPEKWSTADSLLVWLGFGWDLSGTGGELTNGVIFNGLGKDWTGFLRDNRLADETGKDASKISLPAKDIYCIPAAGIPDSSSLNWAIKKRWEKTYESLPSGSGWVAGGKMTKSGKPLLVCDFDLDASVPAKFYVMHISDGKKSVSGVFLPGVPFPLMGYNGRIAWGVSPLGADAVDFRDLGRRSGGIKASGGSEGNVSFINEEIKVKDDSPKKITKIQTGFGGCINADQNGAGLLAVLWTGASFSSDFDSLYRIGISENNQEFLSAIAGLSLPHFNVVFADNEGNIGYYPSGRLPERTEYSGALPLKAEKGTQWAGYIDEKNKPLVMNPDEGFIVASGSAVPYGAFAEKISTDLELPFRAERIRSMLESGTPLTVKAMTEILDDTYSSEAAALIGAFKGMKLDNPWLNDLLQRLQRWDKRFDGGSEPAIYLAFRRQLPWFVMSDDIRQANPKMTSFSTDRIVPVIRALQLRKFARGYGELDQRDWFDDRKSAEKEGSKLIIKFALGETSNFLSKYFTNRWEEKPWGYFHTVDFLHPLWRTKLAEKLFCSRSVEIKGGEDTVFNSVWYKSHPFKAKRIPAFRMIIDLGDPDNSLVIKNTGQDSNPFSRGFRDEMKMLLEGGYKNMLFSDKKIEAAKDDELLLLPYKE